MAFGSLRGTLGEGLSRLQSPIGPKIAAEASAQLVIAERLCLSKKMHLQLASRALFQVRHPKCSLEVDN